MKKAIIILSFFFCFHDFCYADSEFDYNQEVKALKSMEALTSLYEIKNETCNISIIDNGHNKSFQCNILLMGNFYYDNHNVMLQFIDLKKENTIGVFLNKKNKFNYSVNNFFSPDINMNELDSIKGQCNIKNYNVFCDFHNKNHTINITVDSKHYNLKAIKNG